MQIPETIFRSYDIRGIYGKDLTSEIAQRVGIGFAAYLGGQGKKIILGRDVRLSGEALSRALASGLMDGGADVVDLGVVPTPALYYSLICLNAAGGVMITASHNPPEWNGLKLCRERAMLCAQGMGMEEIKRLVLEGVSKSNGTGSLSYELGFLREYCTFLASKFSIKKRMKVVIDVSNGACAFTAPRVFQKLGVSVVMLNDVPDGRFPGHPPEPTDENLKQLMQTVVDERADFGIGFDGDGDRGVFIDEAGLAVPGDIALAIVAKYELKSKGPGNVIYDVACSSAVPKLIKEAGGTPILSRVGHAYVQNRMITEKALLGGEISNHLYFSDIYGLDDALYASLKIAEIISERRKKLSKLAVEIPSYPKTPVINFECPDELKFKVVEQLIREFAQEGKEVITIDGVKVLYPDGWLLIRASHTLPQVKMVAEGMTKERVAELEEIGRARVIRTIRAMKTS